MQVVVVAVAVVIFVLLAKRAHSRSKPHCRTSWRLLVAQMYAFGEGDRGVFVDSLNVCLWLCVAVNRIEGIYGGYVHCENSEPSPEVY